MDRFFSTDTKFYAAWSLLADLVIINLLMIATSFPFVTAGASTRAGAVVVRDMVREEGSAPARRFLRALLSNWRTPTLWWFITVVISCGVGYELYVISRADLGGVGMVFTAGVLSGSLLLLGITAWVYPLCALSDAPTPLRRTLAMAAALSIRNLPRTAAAIAALLIAPAAVHFFPGRIYAIATYFILIGHALSWYLVMLAVEPALPAEERDSQHHA